jgi:hypothetical protein
MEDQFKFIENEELKKVFINAYNNDSTTINDPINDWAKNKIKEINDECLKKCENTFNEKKLLEEYNDELKKVSFKYVKESDNNDEPIYIQDNNVIVPVGGKRKTRKTRKPRRKTRKNKKTKKTKKSKK